MGCSASKSSVSAEPLSSKPKPSALQTLRIVENCLIVWLCDDTHGTERLRQLGYELKVFGNIDTCIDFLAEIDDERVFLIVSSPQPSLERFYALAQIEKIYLFNPTSSTSTAEIHNMDSLYQQLQQDIELCESDLIALTTVPSSSQPSALSTDLTKQEASFLFGQTIKEVTHRLKFESRSKDVLVDFCRTHYANNPTPLSLIDTFANEYRPNRALWWLINPCFISRILNRVHRTHEIDIFYKMGFLLKQVNIQLSHLSEENATSMQNMSTAYYGKTMPSDDFHALIENNEQGFLSFGSFLLTSTHSDTAVSAIRHRLALHPDTTGVMFEIHLDTRLSSQRSPFALLKDISTPNDQICFDFGSIFRITSVERITLDQIDLRRVSLTPIGDDDPQLVRLLASVRTDDVYANPLSFLGKLLMDMKEYRRAEQFFLGLLQDASIRSQPQRSVRVHNGLAANYTHKGEHGKALEHYQQALRLALNYLPPDHVDLAPIYRCIGDSYFHQSDSNAAVRNYEKALELLDGNALHANLDTLNELHARVNRAKQLISSGN